MPRRPLVDDPLERQADRVLRGFARLGAVVVAATGFVLRTRSGRQALNTLDRHLGRASDQVERHHGTLETLAARANRLLDRLMARWRL
jgi:hypothetical protein